MRNLLYLIIWIFVFSNSLYSQSYGLQFSSHEVVPEKRTSLNLTSSESICISENTKISFDFKFVTNRQEYFGYIIRIISDDDQNIDIVYNYKLRKFNFVIGETFSNSFIIDSSKLFGEWNNCVLQFNNNSQEVNFYLNNQIISRGKLRFKNTTCCKIFFGANNLEKFKTTDVPPMQIKDISIAEGKTRKYFFPLSENSGNQAIDIIKNKSITINNPIWINPRHQNWNPLKTVSTSGKPSLAFDKKMEILYIVSKDSLYKITFKDNQLTGTILSKSMIDLPAGNQSIYNNTSNKLYNFYIDEKIVSAFNVSDNSWQDGPVKKKLTEFWQANKFISTADSALYIFGGYGQFQYKNQVQRYDFLKKSWEIANPKGDFFMPRYLAALGTNAASDTAFIIGGYGSKSGDQTINPRYNYELMAFSVRDNSFKHIYNFKQPKKEFCFSNSIVIDSASNQFYGLIYPIDRFNSSLQLIRGSLSSPEYELMGDSIPYSFHDIESFSDLYYCNTSKKLVAVTILNKKDNSSVIKVFTLEFPPNNLVVTQADSNNFINSYWVYLIFICLLFPIAFYLIIKKRKRRNLHNDGFSIEFVNKNIADISNHSIIEKESVTSSIFLFSHFEVIDKKGNDITRQFTPLLKEMFLLILLHTFKDGKGISSDQLYEILWEEKTIKDARNNYSVNIVKLKSLLEKVGETVISKESGKWRFEIANDSIQLDYQQFINHSNNIQTTSLDKNYIERLLSILNNGAFLREVQYSWIDDYKSTVSDFVITTMLSYISKANLQTEADLILKLTNCIFHFDLVNDEALIFKCRSLIILGRHAIAKETYLHFCKEYRKNYGQEFTKSYNEVIEHK